MVLTEASLARTKAFKMNLLLYSRKDAALDTGSVELAPECTVGEETNKRKCP